MHILLKCIKYFIYIIQYIFYFFIIFTNSFCVVVKDITDKYEKPLGLVTCYLKAKERFLAQEHADHGDHEGHDHHHHDHEHEH